MPLSPSGLSDAFRGLTTTAISPASPPSAQTARKTPLNLTRTSSDAASRPNSSGIGTTSTATSVLSIVSEVSKAVGGVPYVEAIANIVNSLIKIREEVEANKKRCQELLDRVLKKIEGMFGHLLTLKRCGGQGDLGQLETEMRKYYEHVSLFLKDVLDTVTALQNRPRYQRILDRGTDELDRLNRVMNDFDSNLIMVIIMKIMENQTNQAQKQQQNSDGAERIRDTSISTHFPPAPIRILEREEQHRESVAALLSTPNARVSLLGMGGIGKTTLACGIARDPEIIKAYPRRLFLSFEGCSTPDLAYTNIAAAFDIPHDQRGSYRQIMERVLSHLHQEKTLFVVDNFETWWEVNTNRRVAEDFLVQLGSLEEVAMIVTLRGIQRPAGIDWTKIKPLPTLTQNASMALLSAITKDTYSESDLEYVKKLIDAVAGIPLAVTLIGSLLRDELETPQSLWNRWTRESARAICVARGTDSDDRLYRLDISLRLSIFGPRMTENAKMMLAAISMLPIGLNMDDKWLDRFQALPPSAIHVYDCIRILREVALVTLDSSTSPHRLRLLPPVRDFCIKHLTLDNEISRRLIDIYHTDVIDHYSWGSSQNYAWINAELSNVTAILDHAITLRYITHDLGGAIYRYTEWRRFLCMPETDTIKRAIDILSEYPKAKAECLKGLGIILSDFGRAQEAIQPLEQALSIHRELGLKDQVGWDLLLLGTTHMRLGDYSKAEDCLNEAKDLVIEIGDKRKQGAVLQQLANAYLLQDKLPQAECAAEKALELVRVSGHRKGEVNALSVLGRVYRAQGKYDLAIGKLKASRDASQVIHDTQAEASANGNLGYAYRDAGHPDQAAMHFRLAASIYGRVQLHEDVEASRAALEELGMSLDTSE